MIQQEQHKQIELYNYISIFTNALENTTDIIVVTDKSGIIRYVNRSFEQITGYSKSEAIGNKASLLKSGRHDNEFYESLWNTILRGEVFAGEFINKKKNGELYQEEFTIIPAKDEMGNITHFVKNGRDTTERRQIAEFLHQSSKMEAIGRLAGGVAHDINNTLTIVIGYTDLLLQHAGRDEVAREYLETIKKAVQTSTSMTSQLLAFSRKQVFQLKPIVLSELVNELKKMLERLVDESIQIDTLTGSQGTVEADRHQIEQVIMNLVVNARDAMPNGGKITIKTADLDILPTNAKWHVGTHPGSYVLLEISDLGNGMSDEVLSHIFEPFYTTKDNGKGTGLGLSTVYGIVKQLGGDIRVLSEPGWGTVFKIYLPRITSPSWELDQQPILETMVEGTETILVIEDNAMIRTLVKNYLSSIGYTVLLAADGVEGLRHVRSHQGVIHLALTDVVMPEMSGPEFVEQMKSLSPDTKVLYMSGYPEQEVYNKGVHLDQANFIQKPFLLENLARVIRVILESKKRAVE